MATTAAPESSSSTAINVGDKAGAGDKGKAPLVPLPAAAPKATLFGPAKAMGTWRRRVSSVFDFILRVIAIGAILAAIITMVTTDETLPFFTQLFQFHASYDQMPAFMFFVIGNAIAGGYLVLSLCYSMFTIIRPRLVGARLLLLIFDTLMMALTTAAASSAAAIVYLAHNGNASANWVGICQQFQNFCQRTSGAVVASFVAVVIFMFLIVMSALSLRRRR
ncbi:hypothetical protein QJS04_geneDACA011723 [Acorus gramineus]|uniref:CASP-like protein n=1 Tax=Acorus gramineus TaxID=55184 RepID=A0AAV9BEI6_ACOGR|nr:hypothetical protein QJS04_geneDACA011723 [Acorus gramineus]